MDGRRRAWPALDLDDRALEEEADNLLAEGAGLENFDDSIESEEFPAPAAGTSSAPDLAQEDDADEFDLLGEDSDSSLELLDPDLGAEAPPAVAPGEGLKADSPEGLNNPLGAPPMLDGQLDEMPLDGFGDLDAEEPSSEQGARRSFELSFTRLLMM